MFYPEVEADKLPASKSSCCLIWLQVKLNINLNTQ